MVLGCPRGGGFVIWMRQGMGGRKGGEEGMGGRVRSLRRIGRVSLGF